MTDDAEVPRAERVWIIASALGAFVGAAAALVLFPSAGIGGSQYGQFSGGETFWFATTVGSCFAFAQGRALVRVMKPKAKSMIILAWVIVSTAGINIMLTPLWQMHIMELALGFYAIFVPMLPGIVILAVLQWLLLYHFFSTTPSWILMTIVGGVVGSVLGLFVAIFMVPGAMLAEVVWATVFVGSVGYFQSRILKK